jgi:hypothetical protein
MGWLERGDRVAGYGGPPYPGQPGGGWQQDQYGGGYGGGYGYGPPGVPSGTGGASQGSAIAALVCNIIMLFLCWLIAIPGIICSAIALGRVNSDPDSARTLTMWGWVLFGLGILMGIGFWVIYIAVVLNNPS